MIPETPLVSVILPVYNGAPYLEEAIQCILTQTYENFELLIINDGSTDNSQEIINTFLHDPRVRAFEQSNQGLAATLNRGIQLSKGNYIARQDQDDISYPARLEKQVAFMEAHPEHGMVGTWASIMLDGKITDRSLLHPSDSAVLMFLLLFDNPFVHSSMMIRKTVFSEIGGYSTDRSRQPPEDYELWSRIVLRYKVANIPEVLVIYRQVANSMSRTGVNPFYVHLIQINRENLSWISGLPLSDIRIETLSVFAHGSNFENPNPPDIKSACLLFDKIVKIFSRSCPGERHLVLRKARMILSNIRRNYLIYRYGTFIGTKVAIFDIIRISTLKYRRIPK